jgi:hypothetical protein
MNLPRGFKVYNSTAQFRCACFLNCRDANDKSVGLERQAIAMGQRARELRSRRQRRGFVEDGTFWKLREVAITANAPQSWARMFKASELSLTLSGRNLATWTDYTVSIRKSTSTARRTSARRSS